MSNPLKILYAGRYYPTSPRGLTLRQGLRTQGAQVDEVYIDHETRRPWNWKLGRLLNKFQEEVDAVVLADLGQLVVDPVARFARKRKIPLIVDFFFPFYEVMVNDRKVLSEGSWRARSFRRADIKALKAADLVFFDTLEHLLCSEELYPKTFKRGFVLPIGCPELFFEKVQPKPLENFGSFNVLFWGSYIPLQGIEYILQAARELKEVDQEVCFFLIGKAGQTYTKMRALANKWDLSNVSFVPKIDSITLRHHIVAADLALGIFGDTPQANRVVPHKVYEAFAMGVPTITKDSPASKHLLDSSFCHLTPSANLAQAIIELKSDSLKREQLGQRGAKVARERFHPEVLGKELYEQIQSVVST